MTNTLHVTDADLGCVIDGSHWSVLDFTTAVIDLGIKHGYGDVFDVEYYKRDLESLRSDALDEDEILDIRQAIDDTYYDVLDYLNYIVPEGYYFDVHESSLFLTRSDDCEKGLF